MARSHCRPVCEFVHRAGGIHFICFLISFLLAAPPTVQDAGKTQTPPQEPVRRELPPYEVVHPARVDARGHFLSNFLSHHARRVQRREAAEGLADLDRVFYQLRHSDRGLRLNLTLNPHLLAPGFVTERRYGGLQGAQMRALPRSSHCHFLGEVWDEDTVKGSAAISTCDGLTGLLKLSDEEFFIQPLERSRVGSSAPQAHAIYRRHASPSPSLPVVQQHSRKQAHQGTCGVKSSRQRTETMERKRERWERHQQRKRRRIRERSVSRERWVETLVVADPKMVEYHGMKDVESYILAVMNIVVGLYRDASIGNAINIVVVRLILLERDEDDLKITHHADNSLNSFCKWQKKLNPKGEEHPQHHDVAVLLTRKDICASINMPCETLGLSHVAGMCQPHRSCSISEDTGLPLAFTVAHELGHNFGIQHDGNGNDCEPIGKRPFVMSPQLLYGTSLPRWSRCSRQYITRFLDRGWGWCLDDAPLKEKLPLNSLLPGVLYSAAHQCRLQYGSGSLLCDDMDSVCSTLWCTVGTTCHSKLDGAVDGTRCGEDKWCFDGECVVVGHQPESVDGGWAEWSEWSACSRTCGGGVQNAHRDCDNPVPKRRGKYCLGERRRYRICNPAACPPGLPSFRDTQCRHFNAVPYKGGFFQWETIVNRASPCELYCRPLNEQFSEKMLDAVADGTPCYEGNKSRDICINGICKKVGCDLVIESSATEDRCGVCNGDGSTCTTVRKTFAESEGLGYVDIGLIPEGARDIRIEEVAEAGNFLALRSDNPNKYFLNGGWTIQWNGEYKAAGAVFTYERTGHLENLTSPGPTMEPLWIQLLFQETNPGVRYEYTISQSVLEDDNASSSSFFWKFGSWTECSVTCGAGVQRQIVHCVEKTTGIVEEDLCDPVNRPDNNQTSCNKDPCPAIWWVGEWQKCSASCGGSGQTKRTVLCIQAVSAEEQKALPPKDCEHVPKPESVLSCNTHIPCPANWTTGGWSKCSQTCGSGVRRRNVTCSWNSGVACDPQKKPLSVGSCHIQDCLQVVDNFGTDWSGSGWSSNEVLNEINSIPEVKPPPKFSTTRAQPRNQNDVNGVVEGDFHYHNNIENVQVDDFYYDYNFINFHEDLSDNVEGDRNDSRDSNSVNTLHEAGPTGSTDSDGKVGTTMGPTTATVYSPVSKHKEQLDRDVGGNGRDAENESEIGSENLEDFLSEDFLLPAFTSHPPPSFPTRLLGTHKGNENPLPSEMPITTPLWTTEDPTLTLKNDTERVFRDFFPEDRVTAPPTSGYNISVHTAVNTAMGDQEKEEHLGGDYSHSEEQLPGAVISAEQEGNDGPDFTTHQQLDNSEIPQTTGQSMTLPAAFTPVHSNSDLTELVHSTVQDPQESSPDLRNSPPPSEKSLPASTSSQHISGNGEASHDFAPTGTEIVPPTVLEGATAPPPADFPPALIPPPERTGSDTADQPPASPTTLKPSKASTALSLPEAPPTHPPDPWPLPVTSSIQTLASTQVVTSAYWVTGNWSTCSTSCGLGAVWRTLTCSSTSDSDCDPSKRPAPAQRCYLRPCATWKVQEWSKCSKNCGGGVKSREVQCFDMRDHRPLRPFHCRATSSRPQAQLPCNSQPCLDWYASSWGQCSEECGGGEQHRSITCPEENSCDRATRPSSIQWCNNQSCTQWLTGSWGQCSASCGGGLQRRLIKCVNTDAGTEREVEQVQCELEKQPENTQKCNLQECERPPAGVVCARDRLTQRFCQTLRWLGRCTLPNVQAQCCRTCGRHAPPLPGSPSRRLAATK